MKKKIVLFLCVMGIMTVLTGCSSGSKEIYTPQNIQEKKAKKVADKFVKKVQKEDYKDIKSYISCSFCRLPPFKTTPAGM